MGLHPPSEAVPVFSFSRPSKSEDDPHKPVTSFSDVRDSSGFMDENFLGLRWSYLLHEKMDRNILADYVKNKFVVYDSAQIFDDENVRGFEEAWTKQPHEVITGNSDRFRIESFDINRIRFKTNFPSRKFLVYNDSFHKDWKLRINGRPAEILRANVAFKGIWLEAGENVVDMEYRPWLAKTGFLLVLLFQAVLIYVIVMAVRRRRAAS